jgi:hypothetical protein
MATLFVRRRGRFAVLRQESLRHFAIERCAGAKKRPCPQPWSAGKQWNGAVCSTFALQPQKARLESPTVMAGAMIVETLFHGGRIILSLR